MLSTAAGERKAETVYLLISLAIVYRVIVYYDLQQWQTLRAGPVL